MLHFTQSTNPSATRPAADLTTLNAAAGSGIMGTASTPWAGLRLSGSNATLVDGTGGAPANWWWSIGQLYGPFTGLAPLCPYGVAGGLPGPFGTSAQPIDCTGACGTPGLAPCPQPRCCIRYVQLWVLPANAPPPSTR